LPYGITHVAGLRAALGSGDAMRLRDHTFALLGLGPGLTPAGDDLLCGLLVGLHVLGNRCAPCHARYAYSLQTLIGVIEPHARSRTTALSASLLTQACRGVALQPLLDVLCTLGDTIDWRAVETLLGIGHSSGSDLLTGAYLAATAVLGWEEARGPALAGSTEYLP
jgi:hypothetical protein